LLYRLFGIGKIPAHAVQQIRREGVLLQDEGIGGCVTFRNFRAPGKRYGWRRTWFSGSVVLTREHFLAFKYSQPIVGVSWNDVKLNKLNCYVDQGDRLCVEFDASTYHQGWSGNITVRFSTPLARAFLQKIAQYAA